MVNLEWYNTWWGKWLRIPAIILSMPFLIISVACAFLLLFCFAALEKIWIGTKHLFKYLTSKSLRREIDLREILKMFWEDW